MKPLRPILLAAAVLAALGACASPKSWVAVHTEVGFGEFWNGFAEIATRQGYGIDQAASDRGRRVYVSKWRSSPAPFGMAKRTRLHGEFERPEDGGSGWMLRYYVQNQTVRDMKVGFEPDEDDWSDAGQDPLREDVILGQLRLRFGQELGIQPSYPSAKTAGPAGGS